MSDGARKICFVTGSRADFGLLVWPMRAIRATPGLTLQLVATGMHFAPEFGYTFNAIRDEEFEVDARVETLLSSVSTRSSTSNPSSPMALKVWPNSGAKCMPVATS